MNISRLYKLLLFSVALVVILISADLKNDKVNLRDSAKLLCNSWSLGSGIGLSEKGAIFLDGVEITPWYKNMNIVLYDDFSYKSSSEGNNFFKKEGVWRLIGNSNAGRILLIDNSTELHIKKLDKDNLKVQLKVDSEYNSNIEGIYVFSLLSTDRQTKGYSVGAIQ